MEQILLSICIPTYNRRDYLERLLNCIATQALESSLANKIEVVISDNASSDGTPQTVHDFQKKFAAIRVVYNRNANNEGVVRNLLKTLQIASGRFWIFYGDDDFIPKDGLRGMITTILKTPDCVAIIFKQKTYDKITIEERLTIQQTAGRYFYYMGNACTAANTDMCKKHLRLSYADVVTTCWPHTHLYFLSMFDSPQEKPVLVSPIEVHEEQPKHNNNILNSFYIYDSTFYSLIRLGQLISAQSGEKAFSNWITGGIPNLTFRKYLLFLVQLTIFHHVIGNDRERSDFRSIVKESFKVIRGSRRLYVVPLFILIRVPKGVWRFLYLHGKTLRSYSKRKATSSYAALYKDNMSRLEQIVNSRNSKSLHSVAINKGEW